MKFNLRKDLERIVELIKPKEKILDVGPLGQIIQSGRCSVDAPSVSKLCKLLLR